MARPELTSAIAEISLPEYLGLPQLQTKDVRGGVLSPVNGSHVRFVATASRELAHFAIDGKDDAPTGNTAASPPIRVQGNSKVEFRWQDRFGLTGQQPFTLSITGREDECRPSRARGSRG